MGLRAPAVYPGDQRSFDQWTRSVPVVPDNGSVNTITVADKAITDAKLRDSAQSSVIGRLQATPGQPSDITAAADDTFLVRRSGVLTFGQLGDGDIPAGIARDSEVTAAIAAHVADPDPHPQYLTQTEGDARYVALSNVLNGSVTYDPPSLGDGAGATTTITVTGAAVGDFVLVSFSNSLQGIMLTSSISATNTVEARFQNETGGTLDLASGTLRARVWKQ